MAHDIGTKSESSHSWNWSNDLLHYNSQEASLNLKQEEKEFYLEKKKEKKKKRREIRQRKMKETNWENMECKREERKDWNWEKSQKTHLWVAYQLSCRFTGGVGCCGGVIFWGWRRRMQRNTVISAINAKVSQTEWFFFFFSFKGGMSKILNFFP